MNKRNLFKGLGATFASLVSITAFMSVLAFDREADINRFLNITAGSGEGSKYASVDEMHKAEKDYFIQTVEEGSVLLRNENNALPLSDTAKRNVTLFGNASVTSVFHGGSGGPTNTGTTLYDALKDEGFNINDTVFDKTAKYATDNGLKRGDGHIDEVDASIYSDSDYTGYKDAAIVVLARYAGEANDMNGGYEYDKNTDSYKATVDQDGVAELSFHDSEKAIMEKVKAGGFDKIIVLLNTGYAMDLGWLEEYDVDACMWIGFPGGEGMHGVARMLAGKASPSGGLVDTYATNSLSSPAMQNFGDFKFADLPTSLYHDRYVIYQEGIYVGYKYYETRYSDQVKNRNNATGAYGLFAGEINWNYADEMMYPFGYGLTYTTFEETLDSLTWDKTKHEVTATVTVKNTGTFAAKDIVELYVSLPWETGQAEKSAIQLAGYTKSKELAANESETLTITISDYIFATYDVDATNGKDTNKKGCYIFDAGDYAFAIGDSAHDALNNVLASQNYTNLTDEEGNTVSGDKNKVVTVAAQYDNTTWAVSPYDSDVVVSNQFDQTDFNNFKEDTIEYLTRSNWSTFPEPFEGLRADSDPTGEITRYMTSTKDKPLYVQPSDAPDYTSFKHSQEVTTSFIQMKGVEYDDDEKWDAFIDQLKPSDLATLYGDKMGYAAIESIGYPKSAGGDGPDGLQSGGWLHPCENLAASTYNLELLKARGEFLAEDAIAVGFSMLYGGGCNMHRTPYGGRNFEYYSEDSTIAFYSGDAQGTAMRRGGLISMFKHFCGNDQETNRHGVATFMSEQVVRQNETRSFEGALHTGSAMSNMSAYNRLGAISTASYKSLLTTVLREEWGATGISITDSSKDAASYIFTADAIDAGTDMFNNDADRATEVKALLIKNRDGHIWKQARVSAKRFFYNMVNSNLAYGMDESTEVKSEEPWWKGALIAINVVLGVLAVAGVGLYVVFTFVIKPKGE